MARAVLLSMRERDDFVCVLKTVCGWTSKNWSLPYACCGLHFIDSAACVLSFDHSTPLQLWRCEQDERSYPRPQQVEWPRPRPQQTTLMMMASHQHHRRRVPQLTTQASHQHHRRPRLATITTDVAVPQLTTPASHQHHRRPRLATITTDDPG